MKRACRAAGTVGGLLLAAWAAACTSHVAAVLPIAYDAGSATALPTLRADPCEDAGFRASSGEGDVVCPGTSTCGCGEGQVCCLPAIDTALGGSCESAGACRTTALECGGPEACRGRGIDAGSGVCCLDEGPGGGTSCQATAWECYSHQVVCHEDDDCLVVAPTYPFCRPADFGTPGVSDRSLDGLLGICSPK